MKIDLNEWLKVAGIKLDESRPTKVDPSQIKGKFAVLNFNFMHEGETKSKYLKTFDTEEKMIKFLMKKEIEEGEPASMDTYNLTKKDFKLLGIPEDGDYQGKDFKDYASAIKKMNWEDYKKLSFFKKAHKNKYKGEDQYYWQIVKGG